MRTKIIAVVGIILAILLVASVARALNIVPFFPVQGGTGTSTAPGYGKVLIGGKNGEYEFVASSTFVGPSFSTSSAAYWFGQQTTSGLAEGSNLYFTPARAQSSISVAGSPLTYSAGSIGITQANGSQAGYLAATDWTAFNGKLASTSLSGGSGISYSPATGVIGNTGVTSFGGRTGAITPAFGDYTTSQVPEGSNLYFTTGRWATALAGTTTDALAEGASRLYFTPARAVSALTGQNVSIFTNNAGYITSAGAPIQTVFGRTGTVTAQAGDYTTSQVPEGTNLYWTNVRFDQRLSATTSLPNITTLGSLSLPLAQTTGVLGATQGGTGLSLAPAYGQVLIGNASGSWTQTATSSLGLPTYSGINTWTGTNSFGTTTARNIWYFGTAGNPNIINMGDLETELSNTGVFANAAVVNSADAALRLYRDTISGGSAYAKAGIVSEVRLDFASLGGAAYGVYGVANGYDFVGTSSVHDLAGGYFSSFKNSSSTAIGLQADTYDYSPGGASIAVNAEIPHPQLGTNTYGYVLNPVAATSTNYQITGMLMQGGATYKNDIDLSQAIASNAAINIGNNQLIILDGSQKGIQYSTVTSRIGIYSSTTEAFGVNPNTGATFVNGLLTVDPVPPNSTSFGEIARFQSAATSTSAGNGEYISFWGNNPSNNLNGNSPFSMAAIGSIWTTNGSGQQGQADLTFSTRNTTNPGNASLNEWMRLTSGGFLGLSTTTPGSLFSIQGVGNFVANATSTLYQGLNITSGCFSISGTCLSSTNGTVTSVNASGGTTGLSFTGGPVTSSGTLTLAGTLSALNGGTGSTTLSGLLKGNGTGVLQSAIAGTDYENPLTFGSGLSRAGNSITNTGVLSFNGRTGVVTPASGDYTTSLVTEGANLYFTAARADARIDATSTVSTLLSAPNLGTLNITLNGALVANNGALSAGTLSIANGGTNATAQTANGVNYFDGTKITSSTALAWNGSQLNDTRELTLTGTNAQLSNPNGLDLFGGTNGGTVYARGDASGGDDSLILKAVNDLQFLPGLSQSVVFKAGGQVGIGTTSPAATLSTQGNEYTTGGLGIGVLNTIGGTAFIQATASSSAYNVFQIASSTGTSVFAVRNSGVANFAATTPIVQLAGDIWYSLLGCFAYFDGFANHYVGSTTFVATADKVVATTTPTTPFGTGVGTTTIGANTLTVGKQFTVTGYGVFTTPVANTASVTLTLGFLGTTTVTMDSENTGAFPASVSNYPFNFTADCTVRSIGVSGVIQCDGAFYFETSIATRASTPVYLSGSAIVNTTINEQVYDTAAWSAVTSTQSATVKQTRITWQD